MGKAEVEWSGLCASGSAGKREVLLLLLLLLCYYYSRHVCRAALHISSSRTKQSLALTTIMLQGRGAAGNGPERDRTAAVSGVE